MHVKRRTIPSNKDRIGPSVEIIHSVHASNIEVKPYELLFIPDLPAMRIEEDIYALVFSRNWYLTSSGNRMITVRMLKKSCDVPAATALLNSLCLEM